MNWRNKLALWLLKLDKSVVIIVPEMSDGLVESAKQITSELSSSPASGEWKRAQALRVLLNRHPEEKESNCSRAIELVLCGAVS